MSIALLVLACSLSAPEVHTANWLVTPDRTWIGADWWANRLQDWAIEDGALVCLMAGPRMPIRTAHWITRSINTVEGAVDLSVDIAPADAGSVSSADVFAGFLIGTGGDHVDHRLSALAHHVPAIDGGLLAVVDGDGIVALRRFDQPMKGQAMWAIRTPVGYDSLPLVAGQTRTGEGFPGKHTRTCRLELRVDGQVVAVKAVDVDGTVLSSAVATVDDSNLLDGAVALVSSGGPDGAKGRGFAFAHLSGRGDGLLLHDDRAWGPVLCTHYLVNGKTIKLTAQFGPMGPGHEATLELQHKGRWHHVATEQIEPDSNTAVFRVDGVDTILDVPFRVSLVGDTDSEYDGVVKARPMNGAVSVAAVTGQKVYTGDLQWNHNGLWMPHVETSTAMASHEPDLLFFSGDQIYEGDFVPVDGRGGKITIDDYLYKWLRYCWSFGDLTRTTPSVVIPDDHDVNHGNIWGAGGRKAQARDGMTVQDSGGYKMPPRFVNMVHRTQTSHLPDSHDDAPIEQGISTYHCDFDLGGMSFIVLADRMFKESPTVACPEGNFKNGWPQADGFDAKTQADVPDAPLLGDRQEAFLDQWATRDDDRWASCVLSQTIFANMATLPPGATSGGVLPGLGFPEPGEYPENWQFASDADSNGWPQSGRDRAVRSMAKAGAVHIAGDQHLASLIEYGVDAHGDGGWAFCVPAVANTWPRRWWPSSPGGNHQAGMPRYTGEYEDGFGNLVRVHAVANPAKSGRQPSNLHDRMPGYGIVRFDRNAGTVTFECYRRPQLGVDEAPLQFPGWPVTAPLAAPEGT
ncbi:MAG: alkaline phosphatase D family protein [Phycisphaerales bacterium]|nr:alkaline phosphatase D family protein [Phycisphaerales bacterium]